MTPPPANTESAGPLRIAILGDGQMGLVMTAILLEGEGQRPERVSLWGNFKEEVEQLAASGTSPRLPGFRLDPSIVVTSDANDALEGAERRIADIFSLKVMKSGGIRRCLEVAAIARAAGIGVYGGCMFETSIAHAAGAHLMAALP